MTATDRANLNPHRPAFMAICLWGGRYAAQRGGIMDFWKTLSEGERKQCREAVATLLRYREE